MDRSDVEYHRVKSVLTKQEHQCGSCGEDFDPNEEVFLLQVVRPYRRLNMADDGSQQWVLEFQQVLDEEGDYDNAPYFFHADCWSEAHDALKELLEGSNPSAAENAVCACEYCHSQISEGEIMGVAHYGEFILSDQQPNGVDALDIRIDHMHPTHLCVNCLNELNINVVEGLWANDSTVAMFEKGAAPWGLG